MGTMHDLIENKAKYAALKKSGKLYKLYSEPTIISGAFMFSKSQSYGSIIETMVMSRFELSKVSAKEATGDAADNKGNIYEIKGSISTEGKFHAVQIRPTHKIHAYIFSFYNITTTKDNTIVMQNFTLFIPSDKIMTLPLQNAHGVVGKDTHANSEYRITIKYKSSIWEKLFTEFGKDEEIWEITDNISFI
jgi:hypothetical protein